MRPFAVRASLAILTLALLQSCDDPPTFERPPTVASITVSGCSVIALDLESCTMTAEAIDTEGNVMEDPPLIWRSSSQVIIGLSGFGGEATVVPRSIGVAQVFVTDGTGQIEALPHQVRVTVPDGG